MNAIQNSDVKVAHSDVVEELDVILSNVDWENLSDAELEARISKDSPWGGYAGFC